MTDELKVIADPDMQSTTWQLYFGAVRYGFTISRQLAGAFN
jgi:hypothetical protein